VQICRTYCGPISMRGSAQGTIAYQVPSQPNVGDARRIRDESAKAAPPRTRSLVVVVRFIDLLRRRSDSAPAGLAAAVVAGGNEAIARAGAHRPSGQRCRGVGAQRAMRVKGTRLIGNGSWSSPRGGMTAHRP
jgi:hypothetical protein